MGFQVIGVSGLVDIGLAVSCLSGGYRAGKESGLWFLGGIAGAGYVGAGVILLALFAPVRTLGVMQVLVEGVILGAVAGAFGSSSKQNRSGGFAWGNRTFARPRSASGYSDAPFYANKVTNVTWPSNDDDDTGVDTDAALASINKKESSKFGLDPEFSIHSNDEQRTANYEFEPWHEKSWPVTGRETIETGSEAVRTETWEPLGDDLAATTSRRNDGEAPRNIRRSGNSGLGAGRNVEGRPWWETD